MVKYLSSLTEEHKKMFNPWVDKWVKIGLNTEPLDFEKAYNSVRDLCISLTGKVPDKFIKVQNPIQGYLLAYILSDMLEHKNKISGKGRDVKLNIDDFTINLIKESVFDHIGVSPSNEEIRNSLKNFKLLPALEGQFWVGGWWSAPSYLSFLVDVCELELEPETHNLYLDYRALCESSNYVWVNSEFMIICDRPRSIVLDPDSGELHNIEGPAISYDGGFNVYAIEGYVVPEHVVTNPDTITIEEINNELNEEVRRILVERLGVREYLDRTGAVVIDYDRGGVKGSASRALIKESSGHKWLACTDGSTDRVYYLYAGHPDNSIGADPETCREAHELLCGFNEDLIIAEG